eukprot:3989112-Pyramimonas_sp.AAC.1
MASVTFRVLEMCVPLGVDGVVEVHSFWDSAGPAEWAFPRINLACAREWQQSVSSINALCRVC